MTASASVLSLDVLRRQLAAVVEVERPTAPGLATGLPLLDQLLPGSGLPRGRLTEVVGRRSSGRTTLLRQIVATTRRQGGWVAWVDASRTLAPQDWATRDEGGHGAGGDAPLWVVRPPSAARAAWCADVLLRSGAFSLVVLDGAPMLSRATAVRLTRLARDANAAFVVLGGERGSGRGHGNERGNGRGSERGGTMLGGAVRLRVERRYGQQPEAPVVRSLRVHEEPLHPSTSPEPRSPWDPHPPGADRMQITIEKGGSHQSVEVGCEVGVARRLCAHPEVPDRRGVATTGGRASPIGRGGGAKSRTAVVPPRASAGARHRRAGGQRG